MWGNMSSYFDCNDYLLRSCVGYSTSCEDEHAYTREADTAENLYHVQVTEHFLFTQWEHHALLIRHSMVDPNWHQLFAVAA